MGIVGFRNEPGEVRFPLGLRHQDGFLFSFPRCSGSQMLLERLHLVSAAWAGAGLRWDTQNPPPHPTAASFTSHQALKPPSLTVTGNSIFMGVFLIECVWLEFHIWVHFYVIFFQPPEGQNCLFQFVFSGSRWHWDSLAPADPP